MARLWYMFIRAVVGFLILMSSIASANSSEITPLDGARELFIAGDYDQARSLAEELGTSEAYVLASEAIAAKVILGYFEKPNSPAKEARKLAEKAISLNPDNLDARFQQAVTFGLETQSTGVLKAWRKKLPRRMYEMIVELRRIAPEDPRSHALLGAWHLGIVNKVGERNAYSWYKANSDEGKAYYEAALELAEDDILITSNYAASTILLGNMDYAEKLLNSVVSMNAHTAAEQMIQGRMAELLQLYDDPKALKQGAKQFLSNKRV